MHTLILKSGIRNNNAWLDVLEIVQNSNMVFPQNTSIAKIVFPVFQGKLKELEDVKRERDDVSEELKALKTQKDDLAQKGRKVETERNDFLMNNKLIQQQKENLEARNHALQRTNDTFKTKVSGKTFLLLQAV